MDELSKLFLQYDYPETKALSQNFLTLVSAILVFSIAFAEKIVDFPRASRATRQWLLRSWIAFIAAIIACGIGLLWNVLAAGAAVYGRQALGPWEGNYLYWAQSAWSWMVGAGVLFVVGLGALVVTGVRSINERAPK